MRYMLFVPWINTIGAGGNRMRKKMRTTLDIDGDVLIAAKELARRERKTAGELVSDLMREALRARAGSSGETRAQRGLYGFMPIPTGGAVVTNELVDELREELGV